MTIKFIIDNEFSRKITEIFVSFKILNYDSVNVKIYSD